MIHKVTVGIVTNVGPELLDSIERLVNTEATGEDLVYVSWEEIINWSERHTTSKDLETEQEKKLAEYIYQTEQLFFESLASVLFIK